MSVAKSWVGWMVRETGGLAIGMLRSWIPSRENTDNIPEY